MSEWWDGPMCCISHRTALAVALLMATALARAMDLGVHGPTYPVVEPDLLANIEARLAEKQRSGEILRLQREATTRARNHAEAPAPVEGLTGTTRARVYRFDPSYSAPTTVYGPEGEVIVAAGTRVNPLEYVGLSRPMFFFDGRDPKQVASALSANKAHVGGAKLIMTAGRPLEFMRRHRIPTFFDQGGTLVKRMGIRQMPAMVTQDKNTLRIEELKMN